jgi:2'-5' RNA ligase
LSSNPLRLFVAVELDDDVRRALAGLQDELRQQGLQRLRWVRGEGIHLTLKFLGDTPEEVVSRISEGLSAEVSGIPSHRLSLGRLGTFGGKRPRVVWVDLDGAMDALQSLQEAVERALTPLGFEPERRKFSPHLTLARVRPETSSEMAALLATALEAVEAPHAEIAVREVSLMHSTLGPGGAVYNRLHTVQLTD